MAPWCAVIYLSQLTSECSLSISVKLTNVQNPELILSHRCQTDDPVLVISGFVPSVKNQDAGGKSVQEENQRAMSLPIVCGHRQSACDCVIEKKAQTELSSCSWIS